MCLANGGTGHPRLPDEELVSFCKQKGIAIVSYSPLGNNTVGEPYVISLQKSVGRGLTRFLPMDVTQLAH